MVIPTIAPRYFMRYFRMYTDTLNSIISYLALREPCTTLLDKGRVCRHKKVAMTCAYLGSKLGGLHHVIIILFTFFNIFIKCHEIHSQNKLIIIKSLTFEHSDNCWISGRYISKMHGCIDGCSDCWFTTDHPVAATIWITWICW